MKLKILGHLAIINFSWSLHKRNQPLQLAITQWREKNYQKFYSFNGFLLI